MSRYAAMFERLEGDGAFGAFLMLGDPDLETSATLLDAAVEAGADMIEVGIPFSDPVADGPVIQAAAKRALAAGVRITDCLDLIVSLRSRHSEVPIGILTYANIVVARSGFIRDATEAGADSLLIADIPSLEAGPFVREMGQAGIEPVLIAAANTPDSTLLRIASLSKSYTYCVSRAGITGTHVGGQFDSGLIDRVNRAGAPPPVFGFGISKPEHVRSALSAGAKGVICGSAIVEKVGLGEDIMLLIRSLKAATRERLGAAMN
jgi:tryptophan synthase alpha chain